MTETAKEVLEKAIRKAIDGGWDGGRFKPLHLDLNRWRFDSNYDAFGIGQYEDEIWIEPCEYIFSHDFAKALWGNEMIECYHAKDVKCQMTAWAYHLQQMVIADDPIRYLGENI